jgi:hypothetical protein
MTYAAAWRRFPPNRAPKPNPFWSPPNKPQGPNMEAETLAPAAPASDEALYRAIIGAKRTAYYLRYFAQRDAGGSWVSWNWPGFLFQFWWGLYRKLWGYAFGAAVVVLLLDFLLGLIFGTVAGALGASDAFVSSWRVSFAISLAAAPFPGVVSNAFYYRKARRLIERTAHIADPQARLAELTRRGGTSFIWLWLLLGACVLGILAGIAVPAYQDYVKRARGAQQQTIIVTPAAKPTA